MGRCHETVCRNAEDVRIDAFVQNHGVFHEDCLDCLDPVPNLCSSFKFQVGRRIVHGGAEIFHDAFVIAGHEARE